MVFTRPCELLKWHEMTHSQLLCTCMAEDEGTATEPRSDTLQSKSRHSSASYMQCCTQALLLHPPPRPHPAIFNQKPIIKSCFVLSGHSSLFLLGQ